MSDEARRVALFMQDFQGGGAERVMVHLANGLAARGLAVDLVVCRDQGPNRALVGKGVTIQPLFVNDVMKSLSSFLAYCRNRRPQAVLSALSQPNTVACWARKQTGIRTVLTVHNGLSFEASHARTFRQHMMPWFVRRFFGYADLIVGVSDGVRDDFVRHSGVKGPEIVSIPNPVVFPDLFGRKDEPPAHPWAEEEEPFVVGVGRLTPQKDFGTLIRAFRRVRDAGPARLLILGEGEERASLEALVRELDLEADVRLPGFLPNPYAIVSRAAVLALSSRWEGLPTVIIEALACGTPVVATDCESGPREILEGGRYGTLVPMNDPDALGEGLLKVLSHRETPPEASWRPYVAADVCARYQAALLPESSSA